MACRPTIEVVGIAGVAIVGLLCGFTPAAAHAADPPDTVITAGPEAGSRINSSRPRLEFRSVGVAGNQGSFECRLDQAEFTPARHREFAHRQLRHIVGSQRWGVARVSTPGWKLDFKGGWGISDGGYGGTVNHQVALLQRHGARIGVAILTQGNPSHGYGTATLEGVAERLLGGLPRSIRR